MTIAPERHDTDSVRIKEEFLMEKSLKDVCFKFGTIIKGSADFGLYWSPLVEEHVLLADSEENNLLGKVKYVLDDFGQNTTVYSIDFTHNPDDETYREINTGVLEEAVLSTKKRIEEGIVEKTPPCFVLIDGLDRLTQDYKGNDEKLQILDKVFWLLQNGPKGRIHVVLSVENASLVPTFIQSLLGLKLYIGILNIDNAESHYGEVDIYDDRIHQGLVKTYIAENLFPVSRFFDDITI